MGMPYSRINIGDIFDSPARWAGSTVTYTVVDKTDGLIEIKLSYQHSSLPQTMWKNPSDRVFNRRIFDGGNHDHI